MSPSKTSTGKDENGALWSCEALTAEIQRNPIFDDIILCTKAHWRGNVATVAGRPTAAVIIVFVDKVVMVLLSFAYNPAVYPNFAPAMSSDPPGLPPDDPHPPNGGAPADAAPTNVQLPPPPEIFAFSHPASPQDSEEPSQASNTSVQWGWRAPSSINTDVPPVQSPVTDQSYFSQHAVQLTTAGDLHYAQLVGDHVFPHATVSDDELALAKAAASLPSVDAQVILTLLRWISIGSGVTFSKRTRKVFFWHSKAHVRTTVGISFMPGLGTHCPQS